MKNQETVASYFNSMSRNSATKEGERRGNLAGYPVTLPYVSIRQIRARGSKLPEQMQTAPGWPGMSQSVCKLVAEMVTYLDIDLDSYVSSCAISQSVSR
jgi:hypothetical protein